MIASDGRLVTALQRQPVRPAAAKLVERIVSMVYLLSGLDPWRCITRVCTVENKKTPKRGSEWGFELYVFQSGELFDWSSTSRARAVSSASVSASIRRMAHLWS